jgi:hypothetical protein
MKYLETQEANAGRQQEEISFSPFSVLRSPFSVFHLLLPASRFPLLIEF